MRFSSVILLVLSVLAAAAGCADPTPPLDWSPPVHEDECDGHGDACVLLCCEPGFACQYGRCLDASLDLDFDGFDGHTDCDDYDSEIFPGAEEVCDRHDNDCDGEVDEGLRNADGQCQEPCLDADGDGVTTCAGDCDDLSAVSFPEAEEICDGRDNDCDGQSDEGFDADLDGVGDCLDCDDTNPARTPGRAEICDSVDNDCNDAIDEGQLCGRQGECTAAGCLWSFDATGDNVEHDCGEADGLGGWCAPAGVTQYSMILSGPARGMRDMPQGRFTASFSIKSDQTVSTWLECGAAVRLRVNDRDGDGSGTCRNCFFGSDVLLAPEHFAAPHQYESFDVEMSIGAEREGHLIEFVAYRGACEIVSVCINGLTIRQQ